MGHGIFGSGHRERFAIANIELRAVARTGDRVVVEFAIAERAAVVRDFDAEITKLYRDKGVLPSDEVTTYCQVGMRASHDLFTLALIGHDISKLRNYYGSWEEWGNRDDTPIKTKPQ